ncbi:MAG: hypothetical protein ACFHVJ_12795 [Aestuariibacter sp.]
MPFLHLFANGLRGVWTAVVVLVELRWYTPKEGQEYTGQKVDNEI